MLAARLAAAPIDGAGQFLRRRPPAAWPGGRRRSRLPPAARHETSGEPGAPSASSTLTPLSHLDSAKVPRRLGVSGGGLLGAGRASRASRPVLRRSGGRSRTGREGVKPAAQAVRGLVGHRPGTPRSPNPAPRAVNPAGPGARSAKTRRRPNPPIHKSAPLVPLRRDLAGIWKWIESDGGHSLTVPAQPDLVMERPEPRDAASAYLVMERPEPRDAASAYLVMERPP